MSDRAWITSAVAFCVIVFGGFCAFWFWPVSVDQQAAATQPARTATTTSTTLPSPPIEQTQIHLPPFTVQGGMWLTRGNAGSDLLRGVKVYALPELVNTSRFKAAISQRGAFMENSPIASKLRKLCESMSEKESPLSLVRVIAEGSTPRGGGAGYELLAIAGDALAIGETDIDGKYRVNNVSDDARFIFSYVETNSVRVIWLEPIAPGSQELNLHNDKAVFLLNRLPELGSRSPG